MYWKMNMIKNMESLKVKIKVYGGALLIVAFCLAFGVMPAYATGDQDHECQGGHNCNNNDGGGDQTQDQEQDQGQNQLQDQDQDQSQTATGGSSSSSNEGIDIDASENNKIENNSSNTVLVPNNNTESCLRVFGIAWGKGGESGALGVPWRSAKCDFEQAADDAFAAGERELGWFWKCKNKNLYKGFKLDGMSKDEAMHQCHLKAVGEINNIKTIDTLREQLTMVDNERLIERNKAKESMERLTLACNESKNRMLEACVAK
jgi:hypothetical protein